MTTCDALRCLRPVDEDESELIEVEVFICAATHESPAEYERRELHAVCWQAEQQRELAREAQRDAEIERQMDERREARTR